MWKPMTDERWFTIQCLIMEGRIDEDGISDMVNEINAARPVVEAAKALFNLCEYDLGMDKSELTQMRQALRAGGYLQEGETK